MRKRMLWRRVWEERTAARKKTVSRESVVFACRDLGVGAEET